MSVDDCWSNKTHRDPTANRIIPDPTKSPDGIIGTVAKIHAQGLKIGIYSSKYCLESLALGLSDHWNKGAETTTCAGYPASLDYEDIDAATFVECGIDCEKSSLYLRPTAFG